MPYPAHWVPIKKSGVPPQVRKHIQEGIDRGQFTHKDLIALWEWYDGNPYGPPGVGPGGAGTRRPYGFEGTRKGDWYMSFPKFTWVGNGNMPQSILTGNMKPWGMNLQYYLGWTPQKRATVIDSTNDAPDWLLKHFKRNKMPTDLAQASWESIQNNRGPLAADNFQTREPVPVRGVKRAKIAAPAPDTRAFASWFSGSKVVDKTGNPLQVYRGDFRGDKMGDKFKVNKTTSGRFYFTDDPAIASSYSTNKPDHQHREENVEYYQWFLFPSFRYPRERRAPDLKDVWYRLSSAQQQRVKQVALTTTMEEDEIVFDASDPINSKEGMERDAQSNRGNWLLALAETWLSSGVLFDQEKRFGEILQHTGIPFEYDNPAEARSTVTAVFLRITHPLDTGAIPPHVIDHFHQMAKSDRGRAKPIGYDAWDKTTLTIRDWVQKLDLDLKEHTSYAWTTLPEKVTKALQSMGYDGIKDTGGKMGGTTHTVWIAFEPHQIKSAIGNKGTYDPMKDSIVASLSRMAKLPKIDSDVEWARKGLAIAKAWLADEAKNGKVSDEQLGRLLSAAFDHLVDVNFKETPVVNEPVNTLRFRVSGSYNAADDDEPVLLKLSPGLGAFMGESALNGTSWWDDFAKQATGVLVHEHTHALQFDRWRTEKRKQDPTGKAYEDGLERYWKTYSAPTSEMQSPYGDVTKYLGNQVEIAAHARQAVHDLKASGMEAREIHIWLRRRGGWNTLAQKSQAFQSYYRIYTFNPKVGAPIFRKFLTNMLRALAGEDTAPISREDYELGEEFVPSFFSKTPNNWSLEHKKHRKAGVFTSNFLQRAGEAVDWRPILTELMTVLKPGLPTPEIKIVNSQASGWNGQDLWQYGMKNRHDPSTAFCGDNTTISLQKTIMGDETTLRRVLAHELAHHEDNLLNEVPEFKRLGYYTFRMLKGMKRDDGHGPKWQVIADRFNAKYGKDFVTKTSDQSYVVDESLTKPFFVVLTYFSHKRWFAHAHRPSPKQMQQMRSNYSPWKLFKTTDKAFATAKIGNGWDRANRDGLDAKWDDLWNNGEVLERGNGEIADGEANEAKILAEFNAAKAPSKTGMTAAFLCKATDPNRPGFLFPEIEPDLQGKWSPPGTPEPEEDTRSLEERLDDADGDAGAIQAILTEFDAEQCLSYPGGVLYLADNSVIDVTGGDSVTFYDDPAEFVNAANVDAFYPDAEDAFNREFWESPSELYHYTQDENVESIQRNGLDRSDKTRGLSNRWVGSAVFTTTDPDIYADGSYGDALVTIDTPAMKATLSAGDLPYVSQEPDVAEGALRESLAHSLGLGNYYYDYESGMDPYTVIVHGGVAPQFLQVEESAGKTAALKTASPAGSAWFNGSVVANPDGTPKRVYHGTGADISEFKYEFTGKGNDQLGSGFYFTDNPTTASGYVARSQTDTPKPGGEDNPNVMPVYLSIKKPIVIGETKCTFPRRVIQTIISKAPDLDDSLTNYGDVATEGRARVLAAAVAIYVDSQDPDSPIRTLNMLCNDFYHDNIKEFNEIVRAATGFDGVIQQHHQESVWTPGETHYVAWFPNQIKSAIGNNGAYNRSDNRLIASVQSGEGGYKPIEGVVPSAPNFWFEPGFPEDVKQFILSNRSEGETTCCHDEAGYWVEKLRTFGYVAHEVDGFFGRDNDGHGWVEVRGKIFDPTAAQFWEFTNPTERQYPEAASYTPLFYIAQNGYETPYKTANLKVDAPKLLANFRATFLRAGAPACAVGTGRLLLPPNLQIKNAGIGWNQDFVVEWIREVLERNPDSRRYGVRFLLSQGASVKLGERLGNSWHPAEYTQGWDSDETPGDIELNGACCFAISIDGNPREALLNAQAYGFNNPGEFPAIAVIAGDSSNEGEDAHSGEVYGLPEQGAVCIPDAIVLGTLRFSEMLREQEQAT